MYNKWYRSFHFYFVLIHDTNTKKVKNNAEICDNGLQYSKVKLLILKQFEFMNLGTTWLKSSMWIIKSHTTFMWLKSYTAKPSNHLIFLSIQLKIVCDFKVQIDGFGHVETHPFLIPGKICFGIMFFYFLFFENARWKKFWVYV